MPFAFVTNWLLLLLFRFWYFVTNIRSSSLIYGILKLLRSGDIIPSGCWNQFVTQRTESLVVQLKGSGQKSGDPDWGRRGGRSTANSRQNSPPRETPVAPRSRRASRVTRQHSYDDEVKATAPVAASETGLGLPAPMPRRASAYDVFSVPALSTVTPPNACRRASFRVPPPEPASPPSPDTGPALIIPEEDRRNRRRGSQL